METIHAAFRAVADSVLNSETKKDDSKYGPIARQEHEFQELLQQEDYENYLISSLPADRYATYKEIDGVSTLVVDTITIPQHILLEHQEIFQKAYEQMGGMAIEGRGGIASALNTNVNEVYELNENRIPRQLLSVFEEALVLRGVEYRKNLSRGTIYDWRGEIANNYRKSGGDPQHAQNLISLCSTGYFDKGNIFDQMYGDLVRTGSKSIQDYRHIVADYIKENPFTVFVRSDGMSGREVYHAVRGKIGEIDQWPASPGYVEICGKGSDTHPKIDDARDLLSKNCDFEMSTRWNKSVEQKILRVCPEGS